ncbi:hypothetical protein DOTSEDRAFT_71033 [Dothistroma septosporum NZE10]|uniref:DUF7730 domain-containing protein n=1 Tax=Dothistroma septosporum (strain NZE10 / CBS 128990) TaxID=675120 RepID=N1PRX8_DOTSN|nr:hypothetical protein DOTSEDRAFT_71033 [Dothistroma septosporum NZE10]
MCDFVLASSSAKAAQLVPATSGRHGKLSSTAPGPIIAGCSSLCKPDQGAPSYWYTLTMVDLGSWGEFALRTWVNINPSTQWANRQVEPFRGLPFGTFLHSARPRRQRRLTGPLDATQHSMWHRLQILSSLEPEQKTSDQTQSAFLTKLPYDVRLIIYEMVIGGNVLHLEAQNQKARILHNVCKHPQDINDVGMHQDCSSLSTVRPSSAPREDYAHATGLLPLLVTCRRIYSEAINTLYSANTFEFTQNFAAFTFLKFMLPGPRMASLRHFRLHLRVPRHPALNSRALRDWQDLWSFFRDEMTGLLSLYLQIQMLQPMEEQIQSTTDDGAAGWIAPMVIMAMDAQQRRGCKVVVQIRDQRHEPANTFLDITAREPGGSTEQVLHSTCAELHKKIRLSLG